jgi:hypothetical protein
VSADPPGDPRFREPGLDGLARALTAGPTAGEMAAQDATLEMFRTHHRPPARRHAWRTRLTGLAAAVAVLAGGITAAYAAVLPAPAQHIAHNLLGDIGVPDARHIAAPATHTATPPSPQRARTATAAPRPGSRPAPEPAVSPALVLAAARSQIAAGQDDVFYGRVTASGRAAPGTQVSLFERPGGQTRWRLAAHTTTGPGGTAMLTVQGLTADASFRLAGPDGAVSGPVLVTVVPPVTIGLADGTSAGTDVVTAGSQFADPGDIVVLERLAGGSWHAIGQQRLTQDHLAAFTVPAPLLAARSYRAVLPGTAAHAPSVSAEILVPVQRKRL